MGKPATLEQLCGHATSFGAHSFETERTDNRLQAFAQIDGTRTRIANFEKGDANARELRANLLAATSKPVRTVIDDKVQILNVRICDGAVEDAFAVSIDPAPKLDPSVAPPFTARQGQYLAFIHRYTKKYGWPPAYSDIERHFLVSAPSVNEMIKTLERNGLIEKAAGKARSIRLLIKPECLPRY